MPNPPSTLETLPAEGEVYQVDTKYCDDDGASAVIGAESVPKGSVIIAPPGSQAVLAGSAAVESASSSSGGSSATTPIAGHAARVTSSDFIAPDVASGSVFVVTSPFASAWAASGLYLWFPSFGFAVVLSANGNTITARNSTIPTGARVSAGAGFHIMSPADFLVASSLGTTLAENIPDEDLPVSYETVVGVGGKAVKGRVPRFPTGSLIRYYWDETILSLPLTQTGAANPEPWNEILTKPAGISADATHLMVRGAVHIQFGTTTLLHYHVEFPANGPAAPAAALLGGTDTPEVSICYGEVAVPIVNGGINWRLLRTAITGAAGSNPNVAHDMFVTGYLAPALDVLE